MTARKQKPNIEYRNFYLPPDFPALLTTGSIRGTCGLSVDVLHFHNCLEIGICHSGSGLLTFYGGQNIPFSEGDVTCIPRNIPHATQPGSPDESFWSWLFFNPRQLFLGLVPTGLRAIAPLHDAPYYLIPAGASPRVSFLAHAAQEEFSRETFDPLLCRAYLFALHTEITRYQEQHAPVGEPESTPPHAEFTPSPGAGILGIAPALGFIEDNYMNKFSVEQLAALCHLSPTHFRRTFQSLMHVSPLAYLNSVRITRACGLLLNTNHTILSIAELTGFSTLSNFNRQFYRAMQLSPREYRQQAAGRLEQTREAGAISALTPPR